MAGKLDTNNIQDWGLEEYVQYFGGNKKLFGEHSEEFKSIQNIVKKMSELHSELQNQNITMDNYIKLDDINTELKGVCSNYEATHTGFKLFNGRERLNVVNGLKNYWSNNNLDQLREKSVLDRYEKDKSITWGNLKVDPAASIQLDKSALSEENTVGGNASQRFKVTYGGKEGYFTEKQCIKSESKISEEIQSTIELEMPISMRNNDAITQDISSTLGFFEGTVFTDLQNASAALDFHVAASMYCFEKLDELKPRNEKEKELKENLTSLLENDKLLPENLMQGLNDYETKFSKEKPISENDKNKFYDNYIKEHITDPTLQDSFIKCRDILQPYLETKHQIIDGSEAVEKMFEYQLRRGFIADSGKNKVDLGGNRASVLDQYLKNDKLKKHTLDLLKEKIAVNAALGGHLKEEDELSKRNVASSRMADLLGVGNLIARSEKMTVQIGDKKLEGCFMEKAEGIDVRNGKDDVMEQLLQVSFDDEKKSPFAPGFTKDACNLEILDYICAQSDRHGGNMFLKLSEPDEMGHRQVIGLQGIDNDLAFSTRKKGLALKQQGELKDLCFISENLANTVSSLKKDQVEYAVKDLLSEDEKSALWARIQDVQKHISENMIKLGDNDWDLKATYENKFKNKEDKESESGKRFKAGIDSLEKSYRKEGFNNRLDHKNGEVRKEIESSQKKYSLKKEIEQQKAKQNQIEKAAEPSKEKPEKQAEKQAEPAKEKPEKQVEKEAKPAKEKPEKQVEKQAEPAKDSHSKRAQLKQTLGSLKRGPKIIKSKFKENATYVKQKLEHSSRNMKRRVEALKRMKESFKEVRDFVKRGGNYIPNDPKLKSMNELKSSFGIMKEAAKQNMRQQRKMDANFAAEKEERARQHLEHRKSIRNEKGEPVEDLQTAPKEKISHDKLEKEEKETAKANTTKKEATEKTSSAPANNKAVVAANRQKVDFNGLQAGSLLSSPHKAGIAGVMNHQNIKITDEMRKSFSEQHTKFREMVKSSNGPAKK